MLAHGGRIAEVVSGIVPAGLHRAVWDAKRAPAGIYIWRATINGIEGWADKIIIGK